LSNTTIQPSAAGGSFAGAAPGVFAYTVAAAALGFTAYAPSVAQSLVGPVRQSVALPGGIYSVMNITAPIVIKSSPGILGRIFCSTSGSIAIHDCVATAAAVAGNLIASITMTGGGAPYSLDWPCASGITISSASGVFSVSFT
jgi:hypothetical protein